MRHLTHAAWVVFVLLAGIPVAALTQEPAEDAQTGDSTALSISDEESFVREVLKGLGESWGPPEVTLGEKPGAPEVLELTPQRCVEITLAQNAQVLAAQDEVDAAKALTGQANSARLPQIKAQEAFIYIEGLEPIDTGWMLGLLFPIDLQSDKETRRDQFTITQVLYAGGQIQAAVRASEYLAQSQEWRREATLDALEFEAKSAYYGLLLTKALVQVTQKSIVAFERHLADAQHALDVGLISNFEVLRAKTELGARETEKVNAENAGRLALLNLRRILAVPQNTPVRLATDLGCVAVSERVEELAAQALEVRPELRALRMGVEAAKEDVNRRKGSFKPRAAANIDWTNLDGGGSALPDGWTFTVGAEWELYAGGRRKHEVAEAKARLRGLQHQIEEVERLIELDVRQAYIQIRNALAKIRKETGTVDLGREGLRLAELRFREGVGTQAETLDAELALTAAETSLVKALHDYAVAHAALEKATARSWVDRDRN